MDGFLLQTNFVVLVRNTEKFQLVEIGWHFYWVELESVFHNIYQFGIGLTHPNRSLHVYVILHSTYAMYQFYAKFTFLVLFRKFYNLSLATTEYTRAEASHAGFFVNRWTVHERFNLNFLSSFMRIKIQQRSLKPRLKGRQMALRRLAHCVNNKAIKFKCSNQHEVQQMVLKKKNTNRFFMLKFCLQYKMHLSPNRLFISCCCFDVNHSINDHFAYFFRPPWSLKMYEKSIKYFDNNGL